MFAHPGGWPRRSWPLLALLVLLWVAVPSALRTRGLGSFWAEHLAAPRIGVALMQLLVVTGEVRKC